MNVCKTCGTRLGQYQKMSMIEFSVDAEFVSITTQCTYCLRKEINHMPRVWWDAINYHIIDNGSDFPLEGPTGTKGPPGDYARGAGPKPD